MAPPLPKIDMSSVGGIQTIEQLYKLLAGSEQTTSGGTVTTTDSISQQGMNEMLASALANTNGLAAISSGQRAAGGYGSSVNTMLTNDLLTRTASQIAQANRTSTKTTSPTTTTTGGVTAGGLGKAAGFTLALQGLNELNNLTGFSKKLKDWMNTDDSSSDSTVATPSSSPVINYTPATNESSGNSFDYDARVYDASQSSTMDFTDFSTIDVGDFFTNAPADVVAEWDTVPTMSEERMLLLDEGFADGGEVSVNPRNRPSILTSSQFNKVVDPRAGKIGGPASVNLPKLDPVTDVVTPSSGSSSGSSSGDKGSVGSEIDNTGKIINALTTEDGQKFAKVLGTLGKLTQSPTLQQAGLIGGVATSKNPVQTGALTAANIATKGALGQVFQAGKLIKQPSVENIVDTAMTVNPITAGVNGILSLLGFQSIGEQAASLPGGIQFDQAMGNRNPMSPEQQQAAKDWIAQQNQQVGENPTIETTPVTGPGTIETTNLPQLGSGKYTSEYGWGTADSPNFSDRGPGGSSGDISAAEAGASAYGPGYVHGGEVSGPGTGTSDSIRAKLSDGETVVTAQTTQKVKELFGEDFFHNLEMQFNKPAAVRQLIKGRA